MTRTEPRRILHVVSRLAYYGAENFVRELALAQRQDGYEVAVLTMYESLTQTQTPLPEIPVRRRSRRDPAFFMRLRSAIGSFAPDLVHTHVHNGKYWGRLAALCAGVGRIVHTEHNSEFPQSAFTKLGNRALHPFTRRIVALTRAQAQALAQAEPIAPGKLAVVPNGIAGFAPPTHEQRKEMRARLGLLENQPAIFHVGRLAPVKNQLLALQALARAVPRFPNARLFFAGEGDEETRLRESAANLGVAGNAAFLGFRSDVRALLAAADVLLITSRNEAMPIAALEAAFAGVPVVSTPWNGAGEVLGDAGIVCADASAECVARELARMLADAELRAETSRRGIARAQAQYRIETAARAYGRIYAEC